MKLSPGQDGDGPHGRQLLAEFEKGRIKHVLGDTAYDGDETRATVKQLKARACIKPHRNRTTKKRYDQDRDKHRNQVERSSGGSRDSAAWRRDTKRQPRISRASSGSPP